MLAFARPALGISLLAASTFAATAAHGSDALQPANLMDEWEKHPSALICEIAEDAPIQWRYRKIKIVSNAYLYMSELTEAPPLESLSSKDGWSLSTSMENIKKSGRFSVVYKTLGKRAVEINVDMVGRPGTKRSGERAVLFPGLLNVAGEARLMNISCSLVRFAALRLTK